MQVLSNIGDKNFPQKRKFMNLLFVCMQRGKTRTQTKSFLQNS